MDNNLATFIQSAAGAGFIAKMVVDGVRMAVDMPRWMPVLLAFFAAQGGELLLLLTQNADFNRVSLAQSTVIGLIAWGLTIGATTLQSKANRTEERVDAALAAPAGTTKQQSDATVFKGD
jgi:hypothetical protein